MNNLINTNLNTDINLVYITLIPAKLDQLSYVENKKNLFGSCFFATNYKYAFFLENAKKLLNESDSKLIKFLKIDVPKLLFEKVIQEYILQKTNNYIINVGVSRYEPNTEYWKEVVNEFNKLYT